MTAANWADALILYSPDVTTITTPYIVHSVHTVNCAWISEKQSLFPYTALSDLFLACSQNWEKRLLTSSCLSVGRSVCLSVCKSARNNWAPTGRIFMTFNVLIIFLKPVDEIKPLLKHDKNNGSLHEDLCTFTIISRWNLLRMRNVSGKSCRENQNTHFLFNSIFPKIVPFMR
jgi:hypothetical protein